jgi:drug/metabolite transporter superfamily protein YnfA
MTDEEIKQIYERVAWLERKMVRLLWLAISGSSAFLGWVVANVIVPDKGWLWAAVFGGIWLTASLIIQRMELKGAPTHVEFIDP